MDKKRMSTRNNNVTNDMRMRIWIVFIPFVLFVSVIVYRMYNIQIVDHEEYKAKAAAVQLDETYISPARGTIYDSNMKVLAQNITVWDVVISPADIVVKDDPIKTAEIHGEIARILAPILEVEESFILEQLSYTDSYYRLLKSDVEKPIADLVSQSVRDEEGKLMFSGIYLQESYTRYYPYGDFASTILGFTGADNQGLAGLESYYEAELAGTKGVIVSAQNAYGDDIGAGYEVVVEPQNGYGLITTIDETIQHYLEKHLELNAELHNVQEGAVAVAMDVNTGAILGLATSPQFDPNDPFTIYDEEIAAQVYAIENDEERATAISEAQNDQWRNKAVSDLYEPGSVFKIVTAAAALDSGTASIYSGFTCHGSIQVGPHTMKCANSGYHAGTTQTFTQALMNSCNVAFIQMGQSMGSETFYEYFSAFGLADKTGIDLPGEANSIHYEEDGLDLVELSSSSFGQSNKVSPIQMLTAVSTAVNGGNLVQPHLVSALTDEEGNIVETLTPEVKRQVISEDVSAEIANMLEQNALPGGNAMHVYNRGYRVGGKSGTSQKLDTVEAEGEEEDYIASFVGVAPMDDPQIAILVYFDDPDSYSYYGGILAGPVVGALMGDILPYLGVEQVFSAEELSTAPVTIPDVTGETITEASTSIQRAGFEVNIIGSGQTVESQFPVGGKKEVKGTTVILYTEVSEPIMVEVPDVVGMSDASAKAKLEQVGLNYKETGAIASGGGVTVLSQSLNAGDEVPIGTSVTVTLQAANYVE